MEPQHPLGGQPQPQWAPPPSQGNWGPAPTGSRSGPNLGDFIMFRWMITPGLIVVIWVIGAVLITLYSLTLINQYNYYGGYSSMSGLLSAIIFFIFGQLWLRVLLEFIAVLFRINNTLGSIDRKTPEQRN